MTHELINKLKDLTSLSESQKALFDLLAQLQIDHETYQHPPIFTVDEGIALAFHDHIPGRGGKSLLLTNKAGNLWLVIACEDTRTDIKALSGQLASGRLSFAKPEVMERVMGVTPGSATPFALIQDKEHQISVVIDEKFAATTHCVFHPLKNNLSTVIKFNDLLHFLTYLGYVPIIMPLGIPLETGA